MPYPDAIDPALVGTYPAVTKAGGGLVWDAVLEYRVWCHPERGAPDLSDGSDYYHPFATYKEALKFSKSVVISTPHSWRASRGASRGSSVKPTDRRDSVHSLFTRRASPPPPGRGKQGPTAPRS